MLEFFRKLGATKGSRVFLSLLALSFVAWGVGGYLMHSTGVSAATVGNEEISTARLEETYRSRMASLTQMLGRAPSPEESASMQIAEGVLSEAISRAVLRQTTANLGLVPSVRALKDEIASISAFTDDKGAFDPARYRALVQRTGRSVDQFERELSQDLGVRLMGQMAKTAVITPTALLPQAALDKATLTLQIASLDAANTPESREPTDKDLASYYDLNKAVYERPETRNFSVLEISRDAISGTISIPDARIAEEYEANKSHYMAPETRHVRHILLESEAKAKEVAAKIKNLDDFIRLANEESKDQGNGGDRGGDIGNITKDTVVPEFGDVAFSIGAGKLSQPVKSAFGWHLIWVENITPAGQKSLEAVKEEIRDQLRASEADETMTSLLQQVDDKVAAGEKLDKIAHELGLKAITYSSIPQNTKDLPKEILQAAFSTDPETVSAPVATPDGGSLYVEVSQVVPASTPAIKEIHEKLVADWKKLQRTLAAQAGINKVIEAARGSDQVRPLDVAIQQAGISGVKMETFELKELEDAPKWMHALLLDIFQLPEGAVLGRSVNDGDTFHAIKLVRRTLAQPTGKDLDEAASLFARRMQNDFEALLVSYLTREADVTCNAVRLRQVFGHDVACPGGN